MARTKGSKNKPKDSGEGPGMGHNQLSDDQHYALAEQHKAKYVTLLAAKKKADADLKNHCKIVKADLGKEGLDEVKGLITGRTPEGEAEIRARIERDMRVLRWLGVPVGTQSDLFPDDRTPIGDRAFEAGKRSGLAGETLNNPHHHTTEAHRRFNEGHADGQATIAKGFKQKPADDNTPVGSVPREEWNKQLAEQNAAVEQSIKETAASLGSTPPSFEVN